MFRQEEWSPKQKILHGQGTLRLYQSIVVFRFEYNGFHIHPFLQLCCWFVSIQAVVGSPLDSLCSHVMGETSGSTETAQSKTAWLSWIYPEVFKSHEGRWEIIPTSFLIFAPLPPLSLLLTVAHPLGTNFFLSPAFHSLENQIWQIQFSPRKY